MRLTAESNTDRAARIVNFKLIGEELWLCLLDGITVYDCQWNKLREIVFGLGIRASSVAALDTKTVVIATNKGLITSSTAGLNVYLLIWWTLHDLTGELYYGAHCMLTL